MAYRQHLGAADPWALDCAYQAGHAYAQAGKPNKALPQLRYYVMNAVPLAARDADEAAKGHGVPVRHRPAAGEHG
jgi:hypothetical protein